MRQKILGRENAVEALASMCRDYRGTALKAIRSGEEHVYIPADTSNPGVLLEFLANPEFTPVEGSNETGEPCYPSLRELLDGTNSNGTVHSGYIQIDPIAKLVTGLGTREGPIKAAVTNPLDEKLMSRYERNIPYSNCLPQ